MLENLQYRKIHSAVAILHNCIHKVKNYDLYTRP